jgi:MinD superfamily P-loop ATPase
MKEIVVISGKGGTGKTSVAASFAALASSAVIADCDVDAADLHLVLGPTTVHDEEFRSGHEALIDQEKCIGCGACLARCRFDAVLRMAGTDRPHTFAIDAAACEGCKVCVEFCPTHAIAFPEKVAGRWFESMTRFGTLVHARLGIAEENSGKLVTLIRKRARSIAEEQGADLLIADGSPGIGCPVIASLTGADLALIVTEPTVSGLHDFKRVADLAAIFRIRAAVCINKADINTAAAVRIESEANALGIPIVGRLPYDDAVTEAQMNARTVVESSEGPAALAIRAVWIEVKRLIETEADVPLERRVP